MDAGKPFVAYSALFARSLFAHFCPDPMCRRHRFAGLFLICLFLAMQAFWLAHRAGHDLGADEDGEAACEFCLALHGMDATLPGAEHAAALITAAGCPRQDEPAARGDAEPVHPRQQGPPRPA
jgi:hypothetical protein